MLRAATTPFEQTGVLVLAMVLAVTAGPAAAESLAPVDPVIRCESDKLRRAGEYARCRFLAEQRSVLTASGPDFSSCDAKLQKGWAKAEAKAAGACPTNGDLTSVGDRLREDTTEIAILLAGGVLPGCGDGVASGSEQCDGSDLAGATCETLGFTLGGALSCGPGCGFDTGACAAFALPATGQVTDLGPYSDGAVRAGAPASLTDNGDGTISDLNTGLMWEKKDDSGGLHDKDNSYSWSVSGSSMNLDGTVVTDFLDVLNDVAGGQSSCFAGYCDWRLPNARELLTIINWENSPVAVHQPYFHQPVTCSGCTDVTLPSCSCTHTSRFYFSSTTLAGFAPTVVLAAGLQAGTFRPESKSRFGSSTARAVRGPGL